MRSIMTACLLFPALPAFAADWPQYRADAARSGCTAEPLGAKLALRWQFHERHAPTPAWPTSRRMMFDRAAETVIAGGTLFFGSSVDGKITALDAQTGEPRWSHATDAPVRFAPAVWNDAVYAVSDDGFLYCLAAADGRLRWKLRGGPRPDMLLGNDHMISRWPARGGPAIADGKLYFAAGIWPSEGIFIYALDAVTGRRLWCNESSGGIEMPQPHPTAAAKSGAAAQGYLALDGDTLLLPTGRGVPAAFARADGKFRYLRLQEAGKRGGADVAVCDGHFINAGALYDTPSGACLQTTLGKRPAEKPKPAATTSGVVLETFAAVHPQWLVYAVGAQLSVVDRRNMLVDRETLDRKGKKVRVKGLRDPRWTVALPAAPVALSVADDQIIVGTKDQVLLVDLASGKIEARLPVSGTAYGLAAADGRLYVSTDAGAIYCFDASAAAVVVHRPAPTKFDAQPESPYAAAAKEIIARSHLASGYCLDLGCGDGQLTLELARRTKWQIYAVDADRAQVEAARRRLEAAGLYGARATVHQADLKKLPYPNYFADLVVSGRSVVAGAETLPRETAARVQRPYGGLLCVGRPGAMETAIRGPLEGAADWTHLYADAANTICSGDQRCCGPLGMLWFRDTDIVMPSRHGRPPAPLVAAGRMFVEGLRSLRAVNVYNGTTLWEVPLDDYLVRYHQDHLSGVAVTGSNICLGEERLFLHNGQRCQAFDVRTGRRLAQYTAPLRADGKPGTWGFLAYSQGLLFGSLVNEKHLVKQGWQTYRKPLDMSRMWSESDLLFALDAQTGKLHWQFAPRDSLRHNAIAIGAGRVYLVDRPLVEGDTLKSKTPVPKSGLPSGRLLALDAASGKTVWQVDERAFGTLLALSEKHNVLLMSYQATRFKLNSELGGRMAAFRTADGARIWDVEAKYIARPVLNDDAIYAEPGKWDLLSGRTLPFEFKRSYGCGILAGSKRLLVYRSATLGYYDLEVGRQTENYGGIRPGCWINAIPAGGLVLLADAASWCTCSYLNQATIALEPAPRLPRKNISTRSAP